MAYLELAKLLAPASGATGTAAVAGAVAETDEQATPQPLSFSQLLRAGAAPATPADGAAVSGFVTDDGGDLAALVNAGIQHQRSTVEWAGKILPAPGLTADHTAGVDPLAPAAGNPPAAQVDLATVDPANLGPAGTDPSIMLSTLAMGTVWVTGEGEVGEPEETAHETDTSEPGAVDETVLTDAPWLGLPLFMESRAALREVGASNFESSAAATATADTVDSARLNFMLRSTTVPVKLGGSGQDTAMPVGAPEPIDRETLSRPSRDTGPLMTGMTNSSLLASSESEGDGQGSPRLASSAPIAMALPDPGTGPTAIRPASAPIAMALPDPGTGPTAIRPASAPIAMALPDPGTGPTRAGAIASGFSVGRAAHLEPSAVLAAAVQPAVSVAGAENTVPVGGSTAARTTASVAGSSVALSVKAISGATAIIEDEGIATDRDRVNSDPQSPRSATGPHSSLRPPFAQPFARIEPERWAGDRLISAMATAPVEGARRAAASVEPVVTGSNQPLSSTSPDLPSLLIVSQRYQRSPETMGSSPRSGPENILGDSAALRAVEPTVPTNHATLTQAISPSAAPARPEAGPAPTSLPVAPDSLDLRQENWGRTLGHQLSWMVNNRLQEAEIRVNPPDLGPLEVRVSLQHHQTSVTFFSHEAAVREALESALPRLREMLDSQGISLNQAQVSDQSLARQQSGSGEQAAYGQRDGRWPTTAPVSEATDERPKRRSHPRSLLGAVDDYA